MKKKILATVLAGALVATSAASLAACGDSKVSMPKGDEVTAEEWTEFFANTLELKNYTFESSAETTNSIKGKITQTHYYDSEDKKEVTLDVTSESSSSAIGLYDEENNKSYVESESSSKDKTEVDGEKSNREDESVDKSYIELKEEKEGDKIYWSADYSKTESSVDSSKAKGTNKVEYYWDAEASEYFINYVAATLANEFYYESKDAATSKSIAELHDKFTFADGVYTATLYKRATIYRLSSNYPYQDVTISDLVECTVSVSFNKAEKCVIGYSLKADCSSTLKTEGKYDVEYTYKEETVYSLTNIKTTDVSKKVNKDITAAIDKAKEEAAKEANA